MGKRQLNNCSECGNTHDNLLIYLKEDDTLTPKGQSGRFFVRPTPTERAYICPCTGNEVTMNFGQYNVLTKTPKQPRGE